MNHEVKADISKETKSSPADYLSDFFSVVKKSIFRYGRIPVDREGRSFAVFNNIFLHIHSVKVRKHSIKLTYTYGLGLISAILFLVLIVTGVMLMFYYVPSTQEAYNRMVDLRSSVTFGFTMRNMHKWAAEGMVFFVFLHMARVFFTGGYKPPREFNWVIGVILLLVTLALSFTGYLLPWDQLAFWAITVGTSIVGYVPVIGEKIRFFILGGDTVGQEALIRFYVLHVIVLPGVLIAFLSIHIWRIRKDGGLSHPSENKESTLVNERQEIGSENNEKIKSPLSQEKGYGLKTLGLKTYGLMELVKGSKPSVGAREDDMEFTWPSLLFRELAVFAVVMALLLISAYLFDAPLEGIANPNQPPNPAKAPWYFLGLQEMVSYSALIGGVIVPTILVVGMMLTPYVDRKMTGIGIWFAKERRLANWTIMTFLIAWTILIIVGKYFRGPNWDFMMPWEVIRLSH